MGAASVLDTVLDRTLIGYGNAGYPHPPQLLAARPCADALHGRVAIVTGANSGLGRRPPPGWPVSADRADDRPPSRRR